MATQLAIGSVFFKKAELITQEEHEKKVGGDILLFREPRKEIAEKILEDYNV
ncbi:hypothetical protein [Thermococcus sp. JCM 11816]|uniref:hypothetical protein n=1 Tax=Thermococcus sp. (strain JCM 11816 / KS-1) TaxID=1295125 RepID=UPI000AF47C8D